MEINILIDLDRFVEITLDFSRLFGKILFSLETLKSFFHFSFWLKYHQSVKFSESSVQDLGGFENLL